MKFFSVLFISALLASLTGCPPGNPLSFTVTVLNAYPHDADAFTQGLVIDDGRLYEGTGLRGRSTLREVDLETGIVSRSRDLNASFFGEGITVFGDTIIQLTWRSGVGFVYDKDTFDLLAEFDYPPQLEEGWGITHDGVSLIVSDGTSVLHFLDPKSFEEIGSVDVFDGAAPVNRLNELEYIGGEIYANVWQTNRIARIDPESGAVNSWIDLSGLLTMEEQAEADWLNGIAYDPIADRLFLTGKLWPAVFEVELLLQVP
jgi:glutamine cyclotransferase